ncbi:unnamed protein product, partial [Callosobruchus maculatus]
QKNAGNTAIRDRFPSARKCQQPKVITSLCKFLGNFPLSVVIFYASDPFPDTTEVRFHPPEGRLRLENVETRRRAGSSSSCQLSWRRRECPRVITRRGATGWNRGNRGSFATYWTCATPWHVAESGPFNVRRLATPKALELMEEEAEFQHRRANRIRLRSLRDNSDPFSLRDTVFTGMYRLTRDLARALIETLRPHMNMNAGARSTAVPVELRVLCALNFYGQGSYQKGVGSDAHLGLSQAAVSKTINEVTDALNNPAILPQFIQFPTTAGVIGFVDGTLIAIKRPDEHEELYINRKGYHSLNVQIVSDCNYKILSVVSRFNGSAHDSFVWANSAVRGVMETAWQEGERMWLLGDSGYPLEPWLHTPILNAAPGSDEANYTKLHMKARSSVERAIGHLKNRFRCLMRHRTLHYHPRKAGLIVNACCALHNMCVDANLPHEELHDVEGEPAEAQEGAPVLRDQGRNAEAIRARAHQSYVSEYYFDQGIEKKAGAVLKFNVKPAFVFFITKNSLSTKSDLTNKSVLCCVPIQRKCSRFFCVGKFCSARSHGDCLARRRTDVAVRTGCRCRRPTVLHTPQKRLLDSSPDF